MPMDETTRITEFPQLKGAIYSSIHFTCGNLHSLISTTCIIGVTYLDHAGATLYSKSQLDAHVTNLTSNLYGNPHSQSPSSQTSSAAVDHVRDSILRFFGTDSNSYNVVFTSGCTGALKLLAECFPWQRSIHNHHTPLLPSNDGPGHLATSVVDVFYTRDLKDLPTGSSNKEKVLTKTSSSRRRISNEFLSNSGYTNEKCSEKVDEIDTKEDTVRGQAEEFTSTSQGRPTTDDRGGGVTTRSGEVDREERRSIFCYLEDNHTSVVGMREMAAQYGASIVCATSEDIVSASQFEFGTSHCETGTSQHESGKTNSKPNSLEDHPCFTNTLSESIALHKSSSDQLNHPLNLFVYPAQSNFCGHKHPLTWCADIQNGRLTISGLSPPLLPHSPPPPPPPSSWRVCLDAASFVGTNPLNLTSYPADFVTVSFYKMFGFPTGLGALLVKKENSNLLQKRYFGGGTVLGTVSRAGVHVPRSQLNER